MHPLVHHPFCRSNFWYEEKVKRLNLMRPRKIALSSFKKSVLRYAPPPISDSFRLIRKWYKNELVTFERTVQAKHKKTHTDIKSTKMPRTTDFDATAAQLVQKTYRLLHNGCHFVASFKGLLLFWGQIVACLRQALPFYHLKLYSLCCSLHAV